MKHKTHYKGQSYAAIASLVLAGYDAEKEEEP